MTELNSQYGDVAICQCGSVAMSEYVGEAIGDWRGKRRDSAD
jgi:hypothetical protein